MIRVRRGAEPASLTRARGVGLPAVRGIAAVRSPTSDDISGYKVVADELWRAQHQKCCYCEHKISCSYNDVEHYRPKGRAERAPGSAATHGYWWLAWSWDNLLFSCPTCNRSGKNDRFPLAPGSVPLIAEASPPGRERPLVLDPGGRTHPARHIQFRLSALTPGVTTCGWWARPRGGSVLGNWTIETCRLNTPEHREMRADHVEKVVRREADRFAAALASTDGVRVRDEHARCLELLTAGQAYVTLSYDALRHLVPPTRLRAWGLAWPQPEDIG